jgi:histidinol dehydrogenase
MREGEKALIALEEKFSDDIKAELKAKASETEAAINQAKDKFFADFEAAHKDDIQAIKADLLAQKQALMDSVKTDTAA